MRNHLSTLSAHYGVPHPEEAEETHLQFGNANQAHYNVPVSDTNLYAQLARPKKLTDTDHMQFDKQVLTHLREKLWKVVTALETAHPELAEQEHVRPDLRVLQPGEYSTLVHVSTERDEIQKHTTNSHSVHFTYGSQRFEVHVDTPVFSMQTTRRVVNKLLSTILNELEGSSEEGSSITDESLLEVS